MIDRDGGGAWGERGTSRRPLIAVLLLAAAWRLVLLGQVPPGLQRDEASTGFDAW